MPGRVDNHVAMELGCPVVELRQYTLHPGARETLVRLFEEHFIEGQEQHGMRIIGQFRDLDEPDRFVWIRGFADMDAGTRALEAFYSGPVWTQHRPAANAEAGFRFDPGRRPSRDGAETPAGAIVATIHHLDLPQAPDMVASLRSEPEDRDTAGSVRHRAGAERVPPPPRPRRRERARDLRLLPGRGRRPAGRRGAGGRARRAPPPPADPPIVPPSPPRGDMTWN